MGVEGGSGGKAGVSPGERRERRPPYAGLGRAIAPDSPQMQRAAAAQGATLNSAAVALMVVLKSIE